MTLRQGVSIDATIDVARRFDGLLQNDPEIDHWSSYIGRGAIRFYLPLDEQLENDFFAQAVIVTKSTEARERVRARLQKALDTRFPEIVAGLFALELGPPVGWPVQYRVSGKDPNKVRHFAQKVAEIMATAPDLQNINFNWGDPARKLKIDILQEEARRLGLSSASIAQAIYTTLSGVTATQIRDSIYLIDVVLRARENERMSIEDLRTLSLPLPNGKSVPLSAVATLNYVQDFPLIWRRDRLPTLTVQGNLKGDVLPATIVNQLKGKIDELNGSLPSGYKIVVGGTVEESAKSEASVMAVMPIMLLLMMATLMIQLENFQASRPGVERCAARGDRCRPRAAYDAPATGVCGDAGHCRSHRHDCQKLRHSGASDRGGTTRGAFRLAGGCQCGNLAFQAHHADGLCCHFGHGSHCANRFLGADGNCHHGGLGRGDRLNSDLPAVALCFMVRRSRKDA